MNISGFMIASNQNGLLPRILDNNVASLLSGRRPRETVRNQANLRPISPQRPSDPDSDKQNQEYVKALEEYSLQQFVFLAKELQNILQDHPRKLLPWNSFKQELNIRVIQGHMQEKDAVMMLRILGLLTRTAYEGLDLRLSPDISLEFDDFRLHSPDDVD